MEFFHTLENLLQIPNPQDKIVSTKAFIERYRAGDIAFERSITPKVFNSPSYSNFLIIKKATELPKRRQLKSTKDKAYLLHSIAHIEYSAIDLALDHAYRFTDMPKAFYDDWIAVAEEEIAHFLMCEEILKRYGYRYGEFEVHSFLFDISMKNLTLIDRMAVVPRYLEAAGLDANPLIIRRLQNYKDEMAKEMIEALDIILRDEVDHVRKGDKWFKWACQREGIDSSKYLDIVSKTLPRAKDKKAYINVEARKKAGFSCDEIKRLGDVECSE